MNKRFVGIAAASLLASVTLVAHAKDPALHIDAAKPAGKVSPTLYGLMTEEINFSYDGGLYGELIRNRNFKDAFVNVRPRGFGGTRTDAAATQPQNPITTPAHWSIVPEVDHCTISLDPNQPLNTAVPLSLRLNAEGLVRDQRAAFANEGYWGIPVRPNSTYKASFYAKRSVFGARGPLTVAIESNDGKTVFAHADVADLTTEWKQYTVDLPIGDVLASSTNRFVISTGSPGDYWFTLISLFPPTFNNRPNGNRIDIMQKLVDMKPSFLRFPGGNYLEGDTFEERFDWKKTIGALSERPGHRSPWRYQSTDGMGLLEFLEWTEDMHAQPVLAVFAGYSLRHMNVPAGPELQPYVDEALEEIEYVTGDASTKWGARRIADGHPQPFPLHYVEIGNEDWFDRTGSYEGRFAQFADAIRAKYPDLKLIATTKVTSDKADLIDEHYYRKSGEMYADATHYDQYKRDGQKVFVGEWATREGSPTTNMNAALGDAAWMTGMERNSDVVLISCYAPLFVNVNPGGMQWASDLIGYDALNSYGSPSYHVQKMFSENLGDAILPMTGEEIPTHAWQPPAPRGSTTKPAPRVVPSLFYVATRDSRTGMVYLKFVNAVETPQNVSITLDGVKSVDPKGTQIVIHSDDPMATNSITAPTNIVPVTSDVTDLAPTFSHTFPPYSVTILRIPTH
ncbi:MAG TPA: alpha-L-arabinofuranosidase C-terminal domain-containing protein [Phycisphaerae bacterium]|nr:alpha-L-arabinofuranosidase C-terminal domain-containing protein [Phycisphaerae bacterium]